MRIEKTLAITFALVLTSAVFGQAVAIAASVCGDVNASGSVTAADALSVLREAVGQPVELVCPVPGLLLRSGQQDCYAANGDAVPCNGSGQDADFRAGEPASYTDNGDTITDDVTGLMWEKLSNNDNVHDVGTTYNWHDAFGKIQQLNDNSYAGHTDWRLPNVRELASLTYFGSGDLAIHLVFSHDCVQGCMMATCSCTTGIPYWTSTTSASDHTKAMIVSFGDGEVTTSAKGGLHTVRAVRDAP
jgi:hypothetical protein